MDTKILIADDERNLRNLVAGALERSGFRLTCAADGQEALDALRSDAEIGLAVLDIMMPRMDGTEVLRRARDVGLARVRRARSANRRAGNTRAR
jgi:two-component system response regulator VicR